MNRTDDVLMLFHCIIHVGVVQNFKLLSMKREGYYRSKN